MVMTGNSLSKESFDQRMGAVTNRRASPQDREFLPTERSGTLMQARPPPSLKGASN
jgi:hypothetical protein